MSDPLGGKRKSTSTTTSDKEEKKKDDNPRPSKRIKEEDEIDWGDDWVEIAPRRQQRTDGPVSDEFIRHATGRAASSRDAIAAKNTKTDTFQIREWSELDEIKWTPKQQQVIDAVKNKKGGCVFVSGPAGTGKSFLARHLMEDVLPPSEKVYVTATTGAAAILINGSTIHSALCLGLGKNINVKSWAKSFFTKKLKDLETLYIDEISMMNSELLDTIDQGLREVKGERRVWFGGVRVIAFGDFLQLPPVIAAGEKGDWAFKAKAWQAFTTQVVLDRVHRQNDERLKSLLQPMRTGIVVPDAEGVFATRVNAVLDEDDGIQATELYPMKYQVDEVNSRELAKLKDKVRTFKAVEFCLKGKEKSVQQLVQNFPGRTVLNLKTDAQVILVKNLDLKKKLCNGSKGVILGWKEEDGKEYPEVLFDVGVVQIIKPAKWEKKVGRYQTVEASVTQIPLVLGWAMTIHKAQGSTLSKVRVDISKCRSYGQVYVALSRTPTIEGLSLLPYGPSLQSLVKADPEAVRFYEDLEKRGK
jgi:ATP-dependent DNA helicase PIF1